MRLLLESLNYLDKQSPSATQAGSRDSMQSPSEPLICSSCDAELAGSVNYCSNCGANIKELDVGPPKPWGFWKTIGLSLLILIPGNIVAIILSSVFLLYNKSTNPKADIMTLSMALESNGLFLSLTTILSVPISVWLIYTLARRKKDYPLNDYLGLKMPDSSQLIKWLLILVGFVVLSDITTTLTGNDIVPQFMHDIYETAYFTPLLFLSVIVLAPAFEEFLFRGFAFTGFRHTKLGLPGAILLTSFIWAISHVQYDLYQVATIFVMGIILGLAREKTRSIYVPIAMHSLANLISTGELLVKVYL